jgi:hypothetical protein
MKFKVDRMPAVNQQIHELSDRALTCRIHGGYVDALKAMLNHLEERPLEWGDPTNRTKLPGGIILHGTVWPLSVRFAVYDAQKVVIIIEIKPLPNTPLFID